jgi:hypothetical protein
MSSWAFSAVWKQTENTTDPLTLSVDGSARDMGTVRILVPKTTSIHIKTNGFWRLIATHTTTEEVKTVLMGKTKKDRRG